MYLSHSILEMCLDSQKSLETNYQREDSFNKKIILEQTYQMLDKVQKGIYHLQEKDIPLVEKLLDSYLATGGRHHQKTARKMAAKIKDFLHQQRDNYQRLSDFNYVAFVLNHKKRASSLHQEELLKSYHTINAAKSCPPKLKQRLRQQLQSYAVLRYRSILTSGSRQDDVNREFVSAFGLAHLKACSTKAVKAVSKVGLSRQTAKEKVSPFVRLGRGFKAFVKPLSIALSGVAHKFKSNYNRVRHQMKVFYYRHEYKIAALSFGLLGVGFYQTNKMLDKYEQMTQYEIYAAPIQHKTTDTKTASFTKEYAKVHSEPTAKTAQSVVSHTSLGDSYYDTALLIHLKSTAAVEKLYQKIDALQQAGKIKMSEGMDTKRYAHSFTMYKLIRPNSKENKAIENLLSGGAEDASYIDALVKQAGAKGSGVKADDNSVTSSNFSKASLDLQQKHLQNLRSFSRF